jgi:hypothetical protein
MIFDEVFFNSLKGSFQIKYQVLTTQDVTPTFVFVTNKVKHFALGAEIKAWYQFGKWWLKCDAWEVDKEDVRKYCNNKLSNFVPKEKPDN